MYPQTFLVGKVDEEGVELVETAFRCLAAGVEMVQPGTMYRELGASIGKVARERGEHRRLQWSWFRYRSLHLIKH